MRRPLIAASNRGSGPPRVLRRVARAVLGLGALGAERAGPAAKTAGRGLLGLIGFGLGAVFLALRGGASALARARSAHYEHRIERLDAATQVSGHKRMGRDTGWNRRRRGRDEDDDDDRDRGVSAAARRWETELRAARDLEREEKRRLKRIDGAWRLAAVGAGLLVGGVVIEPLGGLAATGLGLLVGGSIGWVGALINAGFSSVQARRTAVKVPPRPEIAAPTVSEGQLPQGRTELVQKVLGEAAASLRALDAVMPKLRHPDSVASVARIVAVGNRIMQAVAAAPEKLAIGQRVFTYYCPETVKVAEALAGLERDAQPDLDRIHGTQSVLKKLEMLFDRTELELKADDSKALDIDLRLLDQSLESDLKTR